MKSRKPRKDNHLPPCPGGKIERFIEPCLLLLLAEKPAHGYELIEKLDQFDFDPRCQDPGQIYRTLRRMEQEGLVLSAWESGSSGPARRCYEITQDGQDVLTAWSRVLEKRMKIVENLLSRYRSIMQRSE